MPCAREGVARIGRAGQGGAGRGGAPRGGARRGGAGRAERVGGLGGGRGRAGKRGSLVVSALAFSARGHGFDPRGRRGKISESEHAFLSVICRDDTK